MRPAGGPLGYEGVAYPPVSLFLSQPLPGVGPPRLESNAPVACRTVTPPPPPPPGGGGG